LATRIAGRLAGVPVVIDSERNSNYQIRWLKRLAFRLTRGCVDLVIANSRAGAEFHQRVHGHPPERYRVVRNGVDTGRFHPIPRDEVRQELHLAESDVVVGMFGSYKVQKNHPLFFAAATRVLGMHRHARFLVVGDELAGGLQGSDAQKRRVAQLVDALGLRDRCVFLGNRQDVERLYNACDVVVLPSIREGTPNVLLEAMACGIPVVATDVADNASIVPDGRVGFVVPSGNEELLAERLGRLVTDQGLRDAFGRAARNWALEEFSLTRLANETAAVYEAAWLGKASRNSASVLPRNRPRDDSNTTSKRS
jgi:glycosyltransferase involved in cell wall biosynthesis